jgi:hypothetical protein
MSLSCYVLFMFAVKIEARHCLLARWVMLQPHQLCSVQVPCLIDARRSSSAGGCGLPGHARTVTAQLYAECQQHKWPPSTP